MGNLWNYVLPILETFQWLSGYWNESQTSLWATEPVILSLATSLIWHQTSLLLAHLTPVKPASLLLWKQIQCISVSRSFLFVFHFLFYLKFSSSDICVAHSFVSLSSLLKCHLLQKLLPHPIMSLLTYPYLLYQSLWHLSPLEILYVPVLLPIFNLTPWGNVNSMRKQFTFNSSYISSWNSVCHRTDTQ